jgi:hypothetical protein
MVDHQPDSRTTFLRRHEGFTERVTNGVVLESVELEIDSQWVGADFSK